ncbi:MULTISPECIES: DUF1707 domain-containing protein [unclassified Kitasatospora]|uniref:DUF1707 SHOCT-like domain-containing protein n=1 Tax=unclassified Kitasatospora TaxID=2633591 RepID=UPI0033FBC815
MNPPSKHPPRAPRPIAEDERESAVTRLQQAYAEGHITHEEMDQQLHRVLTAGTRGEPAQLLAALPQEDPGPTSVSCRRRAPALWPGWTAPG